jgi:DNA polymerase-3 subunit delta'
MGWSNLIGQEQVVKQLSKAVAGEAVTHAYLFTGPPGVGKKTAACILAQALNCLVPAADGPCGRCRDCQQIEQGYHPDVIMVLPQGATVKIQQVRELQQQVFRKHYTGRFKLVVVAEADKMTLEAANALLRLLEEPPERTVFILIAQRRDRLLPTIVSRCQEIRFRKIPHEILAETLVAQGKKPEHAAVLAHLANGSLDGVPALAEGAALAVRDKALACLTRVLQGDPWNIWQLAAELEQEQDQELLLDLMLLWYRDLLIWRETGQQHLLVNQDLLSELAGRVLPLPALCASLEALHQARKYKEQNVNTLLNLEVLLMQLQSAARVKVEG